MTQDFVTTWNSISERISARVSADGFQRWFSDVEVCGDDGSVLTLSVPNPIQKFFLESNYLPLVQGAVADVFEGAREIRIVARQSDDIESASSLQVVEEPEPPRAANR